VTSKCVIADRSEPKILKEPGAADQQPRQQGPVAEEEADLPAAAAEGEPVRDRAEEDNIHFRWPPAPVDHGSFGPNEMVNFVPSCQP
jgi:hypothetical protein